MAEYNTRTGDAMDWEHLQAPTSMIQFISQLHCDLRTDLERDLASSITKMNAEHHQCQQAASDSIKEIVRTAMEDWFTDNQKKFQSRQEETELDSPQTLKAEVRLEPDDSYHRAQVEQLTRKLELANSELASLKRQLKATESRADQLRNIIIPSDGKPILDSEIQKLFSEVRKTVQMVACRLYSKSGTFRSPITEDSRAFFEEMEDLSPECQRDAIHTNLFIFIGGQFFPNNVRGCNIGNHHPRLQKLLAATEWYLTEAVQGTHPDGSRQKELSDWSRATFNCIDLLRDESDGPDSCAAYLEQFFKPAETDIIQAQESGRKKLRKLCEKAHELGILMRRATDTFQVFTVKDDLPLADCQDMVEELRCNGERDSGGTKVVGSCLFGGLRKISSDYPTKPILLERAVVSTRFVS